MKSIEISVLMAAASGVAAQSNLETVQDIYAKFGQGDVPGILAKLSDNVEWVHGANPNIVPHGGNRQGVAGAAQFFQRVGENLNVLMFKPSNYLVEGNMVKNHLHIDGIAIPTGKSFIENSILTYEFDANGKVVRWEASGDWSSMEAAFTK